MIKRRRSAFNSVPAGLDDLMDHCFIQLDKTEDMVPGDGQYRAEKEGKQYHQREIFQYLLILPS